MAWAPPRTLSIVPNNGDVDIKYSFLGTNTQLTPDHVSPAKGIAGECPVLNFLHSYCLLAMLLFLGLLA